MYVVSHRSIFFIATRRWKTAINSSYQTKSSTGQQTLCLNTKFEATFACTILIKFRNLAKVLSQIKVLHSFEDVTVHYLEYFFIDHRFVSVTFIVCNIVHLKIRIIINWQQ